MPISLGDAVVKLSADSKELSKGLDDAEKDVKSSFGKMEDTAKKLTLAFAAVAVVGIGAIVVGLKSCVDAAAEEELSITKLSTAVDASGASWATASGEIEKYIAAEQVRTAYDDEVVRDSLSKLTMMTGDYTKAMELLPLAEDLARATGMDLVTASTLVGKVEEGNTSILKRYGIMLDKDATKEEALAAMRAKFSGQAEAYTNTYAGSMALLRGQMENLRETIGAVLLPILTRVAKRLAQFLGAIIPKVDTVVKAFSEFAQIFLTGDIREVVSFLRNEVYEALSLVFGDKIAGMIRDIFDPIIQLAFKIKELGRTAIEFAQIFLSGDIKSMTSFLRNELYEALSWVFGDRIAGIIRDLSEPILTFAFKIKELGRTLLEFAGIVIGGDMKEMESFLKNEVYEALSWVFGDEMAGKIRDFGLKVPEAIAGIKTALEDLSNKVLPVLKENWDLLIGVMAGVATFLVLNKLVLAIQAIGTAISGIIAIAGGVGAMAAAISPLTLVFAIIAAAVGLLVVAWMRDWGGIQEKVAEVIPQIGSFIETLVAWFQEKIPLALETLRGIWNAIWPTIQSVVTTVLGTIVGVITTAWTTIRTWTEANWPTIQAAIKTVLDWIGSFVNLTIANVVAIFQSAWSIIKQWTDENWPLIQATIKTVLDTIMNIVSWVLAAITAFWDRWGQDILQIVQIAWDIIRTAIETVIKVILGIIKTVMLLIQGDWSGAWEEVKKTVTTIWDGIKTMIDLALGKIVEKIIEAKDRFVNAGKDIMQGVLDGMTNMKDRILNWIGGLLQSIVSSIKDFFGLGSPSRLMAGYGEDMMEGFLKGLEQMRPALEAQIKNLNATMGAGFAPQLQTAGIMGGAQPEVGGLLGPREPMRGLAPAPIGDVYLSINAPIYGVEDLQTTIREALRQTAEVPAGWVMGG